MRTGRNAPCPCGSGKKYKACCLERDRVAAREAADEARAAATVAPPRRGAVFAAQAWEADVVAVAPPMDGVPAPAMVLVVADGRVIHGEVVPTPATVGEGADDVADAVREAGRSAGRFPAVVRVRRELAEAVGRRLAGEGVVVSGADSLPSIDGVVDTFVSELGLAPRIPPTVTTPGSWTETGATAEELAALFAAAARFWRARAWDALYDVPALRAVLPEGDPWIVSLLSAGGAGPGLAMYAREEDYLALLDDPADAFGPEGGPALSLTLGPRGDVPAAMGEESDAAGWEVAGPAAYPFVIGVRLAEGRWTAGEVRALRLVTAAVAALAEGRVSPPEGVEVADPATGVRLALYAVEEDDDGDGEPLWPPLHRAGPCCAQGPAADPEAALRALDGGVDEAHEAEEERQDRFLTWLERQGRGEDWVERHLANAAAWGEFLYGQAGVPAEAATEYDLRVFVYDWYPRAAGMESDVARRLPASLCRYFGWMAEHEGVAYPWAAAVLREREAFRERLEGAPEGGFWEAATGEWRAEVGFDLMQRLLLHSPSFPPGGPSLMTPDVARLEAELQRRWLIWRDEEVRAGTVAPGALRAALGARQAAWEETPHPGFGGRTPREVAEGAGE
jgi:SEC-C motif